MSPLNLVAHLPSCEAAGLARWVTSLRLLQRHPACTLSPATHVVVAALQLVATKLLPATCSHTFVCLLSVIA